VEAPEGKIAIWGTISDLGVWRGGTWWPNTRLNRLAGVRPHQHCQSEDPNSPLDRRRSLDGGQRGASSRAG
jgi:hypothetical protein